MLQSTIKKVKHIVVHYVTFCARLTLCFPFVLFLLLYWDTVLNADAMYHLMGYNMMIMNEEGKKPNHKNISHDSLSPTGSVSSALLPLC